MKFFDALEIARHTGKRIKLGESMAAWVNSGYLAWVNSDGDIGAVVHVNDTVIDKEWEVLADPPKRYTFTEAYAMMKAGKWMKPLMNRVGCCWRYFGNTWYECHVPFFVNDMRSIINLYFHQVEIDGLWEEVQTNRSNTQAQ